MSNPLGAMRPSSVSNGPRHHITSTLASAPATSVAAASSDVFERSQRRRVIACVHANRCVPCSSSRASSGAPTNSPASAGSTASPRTAAAQLSNSPWKCLTMMSQPDRADGGRQPESASRW